MLILILKLYYTAFASSIQLTILYIPCHLLDELVRVKQFIDILRPCFSIPKQEPDKSCHRNLLIINMFVKLVKIAVYFLRGHLLLPHHIAE